MHVHYIIQHIRLKINIIKCEWSGPLARQKLQSLLQLSVTFQRFTIMSRVPYDLPQRLKGAFVPDVCVWWTRDIKFEVSWCLWPNGSLRAAFKHESNLPSVPSNYFYIWGKKLDVPRSYLSEMKESGSGMDENVFRSCIFCYFKATWLWLKYE